MGKITITIAAATETIDIPDAKLSRLTLLLAGARAGTEAAAAMNRKEKLALTLRWMYQSLREAAQLQRTQELRLASDATLTAEAGDFTDDPIIPVP